jgi:hypothetical protein
LGGKAMVQMDLLIDLLVWIMLTLRWLYFLMRTTSQGNKSLQDTDYTAQNKSSNTGMLGAFCPTTHSTQFTFLDPNDHSNIMVALSRPLATLINTIE